MKAYLRRCAGEGVAAVVVRRGDADAGVVYIKINGLSGRVDLYGPAPAGLVEREDRQWWCMRNDSDESAVDTFLSREIADDRDAWVLEVEDRSRRHFLDGWLSPP